MDKRLLNKAWRISHLYKIRNKNNEVVTFVPNRAQSHFIANAHTRNIILKSRQLGFTTFEAIDNLDDSLWTPNFDSLLIAQDLDSAETIFDKKIYFAWENLHPYFRENLRVDLDQAKTLKFGDNEGGFSSIAVDTSGRSGTFSRVHTTEFAIVAKKFPEKANEIFTGTIPAVPLNGRVDIESTAQGAQGLFYDIFWEAMRRGQPKYKEQFKAHFYSWRWDEEIDLIENPEKNLPPEFKDYQREHKLDDWEITYYYRKWLSLNKDWESLRREFPTTPEEAFASIIEGVIYAKEIARARQEGRIKLVPFERNLKVHTVWDLGVGASLAIGFYQKVGNETRMIDYWEGTEKEGIPQAAVEMFRKPYIYGHHFAPHDIMTTSQSTGVTRYETAKSLGILFEAIPKLLVEDGINAGKLLWDHLWVSVPNCQTWYEKVSAYRWKWDEKRGIWLKIPYHDYTSHSGDIHRYASLVEKNFTNDDVKPFKQSALPKISEYES